MLKRFKIPIPFWLTIGALSLLAAAAGQAVGPVVGPRVEGSIVGSSGLIIEQAVVLDKDFEIVDSGFSAGLSSFNEFIGLMNDEGTFFTVAIETNVGHVGEFSLPLNNFSDQEANAALHLITPPEIDVEVDSDLEVEEVQMSDNVWLLRVTPGGGGLYITVSSKDDAPPGFYAISGRILQIE